MNCFPLTRGCAVSVRTSSRLFGTSVMVKRVRQVEPVRESSFIKI